MNPPKTPPRKNWLWMVEIKAMKFYCKKASFFIGIFAFTALISGCMRAECNGYSDLISHDKSMEEILAWSDLVFFDNEISKNNISRGGLVGPGEWKARPTGRTHPLPRGLRSIENLYPGYPLEIRLLGEDPLYPDAIFVGRKSFLGAVISRENINDAIAGLNLEKYVSTSKDRAAALCYFGH